MSSCSSYQRKPPPEHGAALIITLAFVVILTGLVFAYFSRTTTDRQLSNASYNNAAADLLARTALDIVVSDFKQEIANAPTVTAATVLPKRSGNPTFTVASGSAVPTDPIPNLIRRSFRSDPPGVDSRASAANSTTDVSVNGRFISLARWNNHLLIPLQTPGSTTDTTPKNFTAPDWVLMTRNGPAVETTGDVPDLAKRDPANTKYVVGRYAYAVYDEGGLLDINVAGYPYVNSGGVTPSVTDIGRKGVLTFADLTSVPTTGTNYVSVSAANKFVLFRNYATTDSTQNLGSSVNFASVCNPAAGFSKGFLNYYLGADGTQSCASSTQKGTTWDFGQVNRVSSNASGTIRTDQSFVTRQELIKFRNSVQIAAPDTLQYLGTFSREANIATWPKMQGSTLTFPVRFYMNKFSNIAANAAAFGLQNVGGQWQYWGAGGTAIASAIPALTNPATADFFQWLNYSLHGSSTDPNKWDTTKTDPNNIATTLAVGAALIDQYDADSTTFRIDYANGTVYGMEVNDPARPASAPTPPPGYYTLQRPFRNVGEFGYVYKQGSNRSDQTLDLSTAASLDAGVLDFSTYNSASPRSGIVNLNTRQAPVLTAILQRALTNQASSAYLGQTDPVSDPSRSARNAANTIVNTTENPSGSSPTAALSRADAARLASGITSLPFGSGAADETTETIARALAEVGQTRTWGLLIDLVAQTGHYPPSATDLKSFVVDGEKRYWLHVAIDRFDGTILGQQLEEVLE